MALPTGSLDIGLLQEWIGPVSLRKLTKSLLPGECSGLSTVTNSAAILLYGMVCQKISRVTCMWLRHLLHGRILQSMVAGNTAVGTIKIGQIHLENTPFKCIKSTPCSLLQNTSISFLNLSPLLIPPLTDPSTEQQEKQHPCPYQHQPLCPVSVFLFVHHNN